MTAKQTQADRDRVRGIGGLQLTPEEARSALWQRLSAALSEELAIAREQNDHPMNIVDTTVLRGRIALLKQIQARAPEVGPGSRQSEPVRPESAVVPAAGGISLS